MQPGHVEAGIKPRFIILDVLEIVEKSLLANEVVYFIDNLTSRPRMNRRM
jgi:hypothetical protein